MNTSEYALQMCRPVTLQVNTLADGQLRTGWPHRLPPGESAGEGRRRGEEGEGWGTGAKRVGGGGIGGGGGRGVREERRGLCAEGPEPRASHPEDLCSLAGWILRRQTERKRESGRKRKEKKKKKRRGKGRKKYMGEGENEREG